MADRALVADLDSASQTIDKMVAPESCHRLSPRSMYLNNRIHTTLRLKETLF